MAEPGTPSWVAVVIAALGAGGLGALIRTWIFRRPEARKLGADAGVLETHARVEADTSEFGRVSLLLDRYERRDQEREKRFEAKELRLEAVEKELAALREELADLRPRAKSAALMQTEIDRLRADLEAAKDSCEIIEKERDDLKAALAESEGLVEELNAELRRAAIPKL